MRLLVWVASAMASIRAPAKPLAANSCVATAMMPAIVRAGSLVRVVTRWRFTFGLASAVLDLECTSSFIRKV